MDIPSVSGLFESKLGALRSRFSGNLQGAAGSFSGELASALADNVSAAGNLQELTIVPDSALQGSTQAQGASTAASGAQDATGSAATGETQTAAQAGQVSVPPRILYTSASSIGASSTKPLYIPKAQANKIYTQSLSTPGVSGEAMGVVETAKRYVGIPYVHGGTSLETGADCSGFVYAVYKKCGIKIPRSLYGQIKTGTEVSPENMQPGDLLIFTREGMTGPTHVAMYIGDGKIVEAKGVKYGVCITNLGNNWVTRKHLLSIRRIVS